MSPRQPNTHYSSIQGEISRAEHIGELTLIDTSYSPQLHLESHAHESACFGFVLSGGFSEQFPVEKLSYRGRAVFFRPPHLIHENQVSPAGARCFYLEMSSKWLSHVEEYSSLPGHPLSLQTGALERLANSLYVQWAEMDDAAPLAIEGLACEIAAQFCRAARGKRETVPPRWLKQVHELLRSRFKEALSLAEISGEVRMHPVHVAREFHRYYGATIGEYRRMCRVDFACERLTHSRAPIVEIALESGFAQQPHFTYVFKRITSLTPLQYRKLHSKGEAASGPDEIP